MTEEEIKALFGSITRLAHELGKTPHALYQWFSDDGTLNNDVNRPSRERMIIGAAKTMRLQIPKHWLKAS